MYESDLKPFSWKYLHVFGMEVRVPSQQANDVDPQLAKTGVYHLFAIAGHRGQCSRSPKLPQ